MTNNAYRRHSWTGINEDSDQNCWVYYRALWCDYQLDILMDGVHVLSAFWFRSWINNFASSLSISEKKAINYIRERSFSSALFTVEVLNLPTGKSFDQLRAALWSHFQKVSHFPIALPKTNGNEGDKRWGKARERDWRSRCTISSIAFTIDAWDEARTTLKGGLWSMICPLMTSFTHREKLSWRILSRNSMKTKTSSQSV